MCYGHAPLLDSSFKFIMKFIKCIYLVNSISMLRYLVAMMCLVPLLFFFSDGSTRSEPSLGT